MSKWLKVAPPVICWHIHIGTELFTPSYWLSSSVANNELCYCFNVSPSASPRQESWDAITEQHNPSATRNALTSLCKALGAEINIVPQHYECDGVVHLQIHMGLFLLYNPVTQVHQFKDDTGREYFTCKLHPNHFTKGQPLSLGMRTMPSMEIALVDPNIFPSSVLSTNYHSWANDKNKNTKFQ